MSSDFKYKHKGPIENWHEGLMLGNGHIGALIYGKDNLIFSLDMIDLWDNRLTSEMKEKGFNYQNMVKTLKNNWDEYLRLFDNCYNHSYPTKLNAGTIILDEKIDKNSLFDINIKTANFYFKNIDNEIEGYIDYIDDIFVIYSKNNINFSFKMPDYLYQKEDGKGLGYKDFIEKEDGSYRYIIQETKCKYSYSVVTLKIPKEDGFLLLVTIVKSKDIYSEIEMAKKALLLYSLNISSNYERHIKKWKKFYNHSSIKTGEKNIDKLFNFGRYFLACNSKNKYPMSLEGVWTRNDERLPPWKGDYHLDINLQMSYESYMKVGDFEQGKVLVDYLWSNRNKFRKLAKSFCGTEGYFVPGVMTQDCSPLGGWPMYALNPCDAIWISTAFDNYYRYTGKLSFLKNKAFPFLKEIEKCISKLLVTNKEGKLQLEFSASPEINDCEKEAILKNQSNFELGMLHYLYRVLIEYCELLNFDSGYYKSQESKLADYYRNVKGEIKISSDLEYEISHRHFSHILCHKNLENLTPYKDYTQIHKDYCRLVNQGTDWWVGFSFTEASSLASYIGLGEDAYKYLFAFGDGFVNDNCFHMNMDLKDKGYSKMHSYAFTLEANMGFVRALSDMMLRTTSGIITIFPAIPQKFMQNGVSFKKLRTFNNHKVSAKYSNNHLTFEIKLSKPETLKIYNNISDHFYLDVDEDKIEINCKIGEIFEVDAKKIIKYLGA